MERKKSIILILLFILAFYSKLCLSLSVGTAPGLLNLGDVKPGDRVVGMFYILTNAENDMLLGLSSVPPHIDTFMKSGISGFIPQNASEESVVDWVSFPENPVFISSKNPEIVVRLPSGKLISANTDVEFILNVPKDAEPGYHIGAINLNPQLPSGSASGTAVSTIGITRFYFVFHVIPEPAIRDGTVVNVFAERAGKNLVRLDTIFRNTGTVTMIARLNELKLFDEDNNVVAVLKGGEKKITPGSTDIISIFWRGDNAKPGKYTAKLVVDYSTGLISKRYNVEVPQVITAALPPKPSKFPWWVIVLIVFFLLFIVYWKW
ncbi:MAG: hypothetical protein DRP08_00310 [Candidatus Aenigmatarchaeota archaeon]|nr:MAG: hypothetical protein DRP08_00310 [Candidatus Aenigmarchaeota archaeon]